MGTTLTTGISSANGEPLQLLMRAGADAAAVWPIARDLLSRASTVGPAGMTLEEAYSRVLTTHMQLWLINTPTRFTSAMLTDIVDIAGGRLLRYRWMAGEGLQDFLPYLSYVEHWARDNGANWACALECRPGFERALRDQGYQEKTVTLYKQLTTPTEH